MSNESEGFLDILDEHFGPDFMVHLMRAAKKMRITDYQEAIEIAVKDAARDSRITLSNLSLIELKSIKLACKRSYRSDDAYVNDIIHTMFESLSNDGTIPKDDGGPTKAELRSRMK